MTGRPSTTGQTPPTRPSAAGARRLIHKGRKFDFESVTIAGPGGEALEREVVRHPGAAVVLPILREAAGPRVVMIRNHRFAVGATLWELPAGTIEAGEPASVCAARELEEEAGYRAATITPLCRFYTSPGMTDELMWAFVAEGLAHAGQRLEADEQIVVEALPAASVLSMVETGQVLDAKTMVTLMVAGSRGLLGPVGLGAEGPGRGPGDGGVRP